MPVNVPYEYAVIRLVPRVEREEFINIGVLLFSRRKRFLQVKYHLNTARIGAFSALVDIDFIKKYLTAWEAICQGSPQGGRIGELEPAARFRWLAADRSTIIQTSKIHPGLCSEPEQVLERLFERCVL